MLDTENGKTRRQTTQTKHPIPDNQELTTPNNSQSALKGTLSRDGFGFWWHVWLILGLNRGQGHFFFFMCSIDFIFQKEYFSRLMWVYVGLILLAAYFCHSFLSQVEFCIALRVVGAVLVVFLRRWRKICTILQPRGSKGRFLKKCPKPIWPNNSKETWAKYTPVTLSQRKLALTAETQFFCHKILGAPKKF